MKLHYFDAERADSLYRRGCRLIRLGWLLLAWAAAMGGWRLYEGSFLGAAFFLVACAVVAVNLRLNYRTRRTLREMAGRPR